MADGSTDGREVAEQLKVSPACVYALVAEGRLSAVRVGIRRGVLRFVEDDIRSFIDGARTSPKPVRPRARPRLKHIVL